MCFFLAVILLGAVSAQPDPYDVDALFVCTHKTAGRSALIRKQLRVYF